MTDTPTPPGAISDERILRMVENAEQRDIAGEPCPQDDRIIELGRALLAALAAQATARETAIRDCIAELWKRVEREEYGHAKAAVTLDIDALNALLAKPTATRHRPISDEVRRMGEDYVDGLLGKAQP